MSIERQIAVCTEHYKRWKDVALTAEGNKARKAMERAFFWVELQTAFIALHVIEQRVSANDTVAKRKLIVAKTNLTKKLAEYADKTLNELETN